VLWVLRPIVWFATACTITTILHELAHASTVYAFGVPSTLFNYSVGLDRRHVSAVEWAVIGAAGPVFCLALGMLAWLLRGRMRGSSVELPVLYVSIFGLGTFFGNLMSTPLVGDFSRIAVVLDWPMGLRRAIGALGALCLAGVMVWAGRQLVQLRPPGIGRAGGLLGMIVLPVVAGTAVVILINQPMPREWLFARAGEAGFWVAAAIGAWLATTRSQNSGDTLRLRWLDGAALLVVVVIVRLMVRGIPFVP
jgi:hypothetical protein